MHSSKTTRRHRDNALPRIQQSTIRQNLLPRTFCLDCWLRCHSCVQSLTLSIQAVLGLPAFSSGFRWKCQRGCPRVSVLGALVLVSDSILQELSRPRRCSTVIMHRRRLRKSKERPYAFVPLAYWRGRTSFATGHCHSRKFRMPLPLTNLIYENRKRSTCTLLLLRLLHCVKSSGQLINGVSRLNDTRSFIVNVSATAMF